MGSRQTRRSRGEEDNRVPERQTVDEERPTAVETGAETQEEHGGGEPASTTATAAAANEDDDDDDDDDIVIVLTHLLRR